MERPKQTPHWDFSSTALAKAESPQQTREEDGTSTTPRRTTTCKSAVSRALRARAFRAVASATVALVVLCAARLPRSAARAGARRS